ncbi:hypothetical protein M8C21_022281 [Ambrosia artemisiifolia]|uniref:Uncharacterized protein n=1 Tax=Ambrosia artemisiifolia TaxID=4212 RepID=A0AAD5BP45_AMBAR|nr:hypothetical protein M8C21_022281 [Ambrosia artemisiifolia]
MLELENHTAHCRHCKAQRNDIKKQSKHHHTSTREVWRRNQSICWHLDK